MKVVVEQSGMGNSAQALTFQSPFHMSVPCKRCDSNATLMMIVVDDEQLLVAERPVDAKVWPHDSSSIAIYLCTNCGSMRARWNQG